MNLILVVLFSGQALAGIDTRGQGGEKSPKSIETQIDIKI